MERIDLFKRKLKIRKTNITDVDLMLKMDKQEETQKYLGGIKNKSKEERIELLKRKKDSKTILLDDMPIGFIELKKENDKAELSFIFDYDYTNKGYCTESCKELINKSKIKEIYAYVNKDNIPSIKVLEKLGFKQTKSDREEFLKYQKIKM